VSQCNTKLFINKLDLEYVNVKGENDEQNTNRNNGQKSIMDENNLVIIKIGCIYFKGEK